MGSGARESTFVIVLLAALAGIFLYRASGNDSTAIKLRDNTFFISNPDTTMLRRALSHYEVRFHDVVVAQALLETGHFNSRSCKEDNNLFGLYDSKNKRYFKFGHWTGSVQMYKSFQDRYTGSDDEESYISWLMNVGYAEDADYVKKLRKIIKQIRNGK